MVKQYQAYGLICNLKGGNSWNPGMADVTILAGARTNEQRLRRSGPVA